ncbi:MAG TPA: HEAT repeat domain-containing protein [Longimicrobium sp.]|nr:HEAT repeat domain-containing protein [Longimicrobium sp.]
MTMTPAEAAVRALLRPTHDSAAWEAGVRALDRDPALVVLIAILFGAGETQHDRAMAATILGTLGDARALPVLVQALRVANDPVVRARAGLALGQLGTAAPGAEGALVDALADPDEFVRESAARVLGSQGASGESAALARAAQTDPAPASRQAAARALAQIRGEG